jgi:Permuted papain-like amidase enzyme, YaeF/YiiX, C92 family
MLMSLLIFACQSKKEDVARVDLPSQIKTEEAAPLPSEKEIQEGDLIFHTSTSNQSLAIQIASESKYSHVAVIFQDGPKYYVLEAVQPVKMTPLETFINRGKNKHYVIKRLKTSEAVLTPEGILKMKDIGKKHLNKDYDLRFEWSDDKIYCSELVWKIYDQAFGIQIGELQRIKDFDLSDPIVKKKAKDRYGNNIPLEELIITPDRMFQSDKLETVTER